ncbi:DUF5937 family protein [Lentilactobacillus raoultii]|uniref:DUF5937 family protein n=1 Tax=Lentilactobacillus raoultii TaxID=1987503 RepID=A0ABW3PK54_9LACO|nr:metalloregulator ArsR/SmtB family transcription factor [Lentilactobacillus raoultii]
MTIKISFGDYALQNNETLTQRIQFVYSPLNELFRSLHVLLNPRHHGMNIDWALEARQTLSDDFFNQLHYFELIYELGVPPIFFNNFENLTNDLDEEINNLKRFLSHENPKNVWQSLAQAAQQRENQFIPKLAKSLEWRDYQPTNSKQLLADLQSDPQKVYGNLFGFIDDYRRAVFDKTWQDRSLSQFLINEIKNQSTYLRDHGFVNLINHLEVDRLHWQQNQLMVTKPFDQQINLGNHDVILLVPSYFVWPHLFVDRFEDGVTITYDALNKIKTKVNPDELSEIFNALSDPVRLRIMKYLSDEPLTTQSLGQIMTMSASTVSHHLKLLKQAKLVKTQKDRKFVLYSPTNLIDDLIPGFYTYLNQSD